MPPNFRYTLDWKSRKYTCPACGRNKFVRYIDTFTGECLPPEYGRCDGEINCSYFLNPYQSGYAKKVWRDKYGQVTTETIAQQHVVQPIKKTEAFMPEEIVSQTKGGYELNVFVQNLLNTVPFPFDWADVEKVIELYHLGTVKHGYRKGAITFPFIDLNNRINAIQVKAFNPNNNTIASDFLHSIIEKWYTANKKPLPEWLSEYLQNDKKVRCFFGEHLLSQYPKNPIVLVESPKSAIYATLYFGLPTKPTDRIWLATFTLRGFDEAKCQCLKGRDVLLFPDTSKKAVHGDKYGITFEYWHQKGKDIKKNINDISIRITDILEKIATEEERKKGYDVADYLIQLDWRRFRKHEVGHKTEESQEPQYDYPPEWDF